MRTTVAAIFALGLVVQLPASCTGRRQRDYGPTCSAFLGSSGPQRDIYHWWILGFVAGTSRERAAESQVSLPRFLPDEIETWITKYCTDQPLDPMAKAAMSLVDELKARAR